MKSFFFRIAILACGLALSACDLSSVGSVSFGKSGSQVQAASGPTVAPSSIPTVTPVPTIPVSLPTSVPTSTPSATPSATSSPSPAKSASPIPIASGPGQIWYIRADGGTRYSSNVTAGQCNGKYDTPYSGTGVNQNCAFNDYRYLWDDGSYGNWNLHKWVISGGDTIILRNGPWRVGFQTDGQHGIETFCVGGTGPYDCYNPPFPPGTASQHTRILGENYQNCSQSNMTQIFGGHGVTTALNLRSAQYVDVECLEITRHSQCVRHGDSPDTVGCNTSLPLDDYDGDGVTTDGNTHDLLLQDLWIHGHTDRGIIGNIGGGVTANRVDIAYNGMAGWDFDDGSGSNGGYGTPNAPGSVWNFKNSIIEWSGCNQEYPITHTFPALSCSGQSNAGYGDGVGTPPGTGMNVNIDHSTFRYNVQDGLDVGHVDTGNFTLNITNSEAYGNEGGTFKWGPNFTTVVMENNLAEANCNRMAYPLTGAPSTYNAHLSDFCRSGDAVSFNFRHAGTALLANNTIVSYASTTFDIQCWDQAGEGSPNDNNTDCSAATLTFKNNLVLDYNDPLSNDYGGNSGPGLFYFRDPIGTIIENNNLYSGVAHGTLTPSKGYICPTGFSGDVCNISPQFVNQPPGNGQSFVESELDNFNFTLQNSSPAKKAGITIQGLTTDYNGTTRGSPPSIGAVE
jgi:hypothetical protein